MHKLISLVLPLMLLVGCTPNKSIEEKHNYHEIKDRLIAWNDIFIQEEEEYYVYFYSERCGHCNDIKQNIINFYYKDVVYMYFVCTDIDSVTGPRSDIKGIDNIDDFYIFGTPFLTQLSSHKINDYYVGVSEIKGFISTH